MALYVLVMLLQGTVFGLFSAFVANEKNRDPLRWFLLGFLFSFVALLSLIAIRTRDRSSVGLDHSPYSTATCPYCREEIHADAVICRHCRSDLSNNRPLVVSDTSTGEAANPLAAAMQQALAKPPPLWFRTPGPVRVKRIAAGSGETLFEVDFRKGILFGVVPSYHASTDVLIYADGNFFLAPRAAVPSDAIAEEH